MRYEIWQLNAYGWVRVYTSWIKSTTEQVLEHLKLNCVVEMVEKEEIQSFEPLS